ncbi:MAG: hypothetical protein KF868_15345 [Acidobacteria bacterium]|nr:hypothetical protein [Acidobacteriota bacterium]MCW5970954.1 hypothetical protein [Blastocatellales bacterium]
MMAENVRRGVNRHVQLRREGDVKTLPPAPKKIAVPRPRSCVWLLLKEGEKLTEEERIVRQAVLDASPVVGQGLKLVESYRMYGRANFDGCGSFRECLKAPKGAKDL